jgi:hypothetical protein
MSIRFNRLALATAALGLAIAGSAIATSSAEASPLNGGRGGWGHHGHFGPGFGHGRGHWGRGYWGPHVIGVGYGGYGPRCRFVERHNRWGEIVIRKVCFGPGWR